jgi:rhodanese-related sulfurtransferase
MAHQHAPAFLAIVDDSKARVKEVTVAQTLARLKANPKAVLVDVREDREWDAGHAAQAKHLGKGVIERDINEAVPDPATELILYCGGGFRSALAGDALQKMGYTNVWSMAGGWRAWNAEGGPTA